MTKLFIDRPIFASVVSILIVLFGAVSYFSLPTSQYPNITPPVIRVTASYPGATPPVIADTVAQPLEQQINGVEGMLYMSGRASSNGQYQLDITFELGTDPDTALMLVQNRVSVAEPQLPEDVKRIGVTVRKQSSAMVNIIALDSTDARLDPLFLSNYAVNNIKDPLLRIRGVGDVTIFPQKDYSMRIWLDPNALRNRQTTVSDVVNAIKNQNVQVAAGRLGQEPAPTDTEFELGVTTLGRLTEPSQFEDIVVRSDQGRIVRVRDVARVEVGSKDYDMMANRNGRPAIVMVVYQTPEGNAVEIAERVRETLARQTRNMPHGMRVHMDYDVSEFVEASLEEVYHTLFEAFGLVVLVVLVFLGNWRTTLVPVITIPVALIGTFAVMKLFGFSLNTVTLFGLVLAIGIVVDDSIVVVENVERVMQTYHLPPREATIKAMGEITGPIISISLVLMAVFVPPSLLTGISGEIYRQFALTIAVSTAFSAINALTLSPALCALLLKPHDPNKKEFWFNAKFNAGFAVLTDKVGAMVAWLTRRFVLASILFVIGLFLVGEAFVQTPTAFVPNEDQGILLVDLRLPPGASQARTREAFDAVSPAIARIPGVRSFNAVTGYSMIAGPASNHGFGFITLEGWTERAEKGQSLPLIAAQVQRILATVESGVAVPFQLPPIPGLGTGGGFEMRILDQRNYGSDTLAQVTNDVVEAARGQQRIGMAMTSFLSAAPQMRVNIDRELAQRLNVPLSDVFSTLSATLGASYVNDFNLLGRTYQVRVSADAPFRREVDDAMQFQVRSRDGRLVPLGAFTRAEETVFPPFVERFNLYPSTLIMGGPKPGVSSGDAIHLMEQVADDQLPEGMTYEWSGVALQERLVEGQIIPVFSLALLVVLLILAAQYESWSYPFAIVFTIPFAVLGAMAAIVSIHIPNNLFVQAGLILLVGLSAKNAILIVEVAKEFYEGGMNAVDAAIKAREQRFRPIVMTSLAFILGVVPLVIASGAGANSRRSLGTAVFGGMLFETFIGMFVSPFLFVAVTRGAEWYAKKFPKAPAPAPAGAEHAAAGPTEATEPVAPEGKHS